MAIKGYNSYRGRGNPVRIFIAIGLVAVILLAAGYITAQNYIVYDDEGKAHFELPFHRTETPVEDEQPSIPDDEIYIEYITPEDPLVPVEALHASQLPKGALKLAPEAVLAEADEAMIIEVKRQNGSIAYATEVNVPAQIGVEKEPTLSNLKALLAADKYTVARMAVLCDSYFVRAYHDAAFLLASGSFWYDGGGWTWLNPSDPNVLTYTSSLCQEYAALGFDEILLDYFSYPLTGRLSSIAIEDDVDRVQVLREFSGALRSGLPEDMVLSIVIRSDTSPEVGLTPEMLAECFDRIYIAPDTDAAELLRTLPADYDRDTRVIQMSYTAPLGGSYAVVPGDSQ